MVKRSTWSAVAVAVFAAAALCAWATAPTTASASTVWLCASGIARNPCLSREQTTVELANGSSYVERAKPSKRPPIDCFYVYGTVSGQSTENANLKIGAEERQAAVHQASRFSQACRVYAPIYRQLTTAAISAPGGVTLQGIVTAYFGVVGAFDEYLADYNHGRGFVLIGDSQGAAILTELIREQIDPNPLLRAKLVSAILLGGNVIVPEGKTVGGSFEHIPTCQSELQTGCLIAFFELPPGTADPVVLRAGDERTDSQPGSGVRKPDRARSGRPSGVSAWLLLDRALPRTAQTVRAGAERDDPVGGDARRVFSPV